jgi:hypothetical protein
MNVYEDDTWRLVTEIQKLSFLGKPVIEIKDLEDLGLEQIPDFWSLILGFKSRNLNQRLWALERIFGQNEPAGKIFNLLAYQLPEKINNFAEYDLMVKSGKLEYEEALVDLVVN